MGESKRRGTRDERVAAAVAQKKSRLDEIKQRLGLPPEAEFLGYLVRAAEGEFLKEVEESESVVQRAYISAPEQAMRFGRYVDAYQFVRTDKGDAVVGLFALEGRFEVVVVA